MEQAKYLGRVTVALTAITKDRVKGFGNDRFAGYAVVSFMATGVLGSALQRR